MLVDHKLHRGPSAPIRRQKEALDEKTCSVGPVGGTNLMEHTGRDYESFEQTASSSVRCGRRLVDLWGPRMKFCVQGVMKLNSCYEIKVLWVTVGPFFF